MAAAMTDVRKMKPGPDDIVIDETKLRILDYLKMNNDSVSNYTAEELAELERTLKKKFEKK